MKQLLFLSLLLIVVSADPKFFIATAQTYLYFWSDQYVSMIDLATQTNSGTTYVYQTDYEPFDASVFYSTVDPTTGTYYITGGNINGMPWPLYAVSPTLETTEVDYVWSTAPEAIWAVNKTCLYALAPVGSTSSNYALYAVNPQSGEGTTISSNGSPWISTILVDMDVSNQVIYGINNEYNWLVVWDLKSDTTTLYNLTKTVEESILADVAFSQSTGSLFVTAEQNLFNDPTNTYVLFEVDVTSGATTQLIVFEAYVWVYNMVINQAEAMIYFLLQNDNNDSFLMGMYDITTGKLTNTTLSGLTMNTDSFGYFCMEQMISS